jgi:hypothetical protein
VDNFFKEVVGFSIDYRVLYFFNKAFKTLNLDGIIPSLCSYRRGRDTNRKQVARAVSQLLPFQDR